MQSNNIKNAISEIVKTTIPLKNIDPNTKTIVEEKLKQERENARINGH